MEHITTLFGDKADQMIEALELGKLLHWKPESVEGRTVLKLYVGDE